MKTLLNNKYSTFLSVLLIIPVVVSCTREEENLPLATFPDVGAIFVNDGFVGLGSNFYFPFIDGGAKPDVFSVDDTEGYIGTSSIRIDVPDADDPGGSFAGAAFIIDGTGRNLTKYNALTFWARASQSAAIDEFGFGVNTSGNSFQVAVNNLRLTGIWKKYIIPIPDASRLINEKGMFYFATGGVCPAGDGQCPPQNNSGPAKKGFTFWMDEIQFESVGTIRLIRAAIQNGNDEVINALVGQSVSVNGGMATFNTPNGLDLNLNVVSRYFELTSSDNNVAVANGSELVAANTGITKATATLSGINATGSLTLQVIPDAPQPTRPESTVTSVFSDSYQDIPVDIYKGEFGGQSTLGGRVNLNNGSSIITYTNLDYAVIEFPPVDVSARNFLHVDLYTSDNTDGASLNIELYDVGPNGTNQNNNGQPTGDDSKNTYVFRSPGLKSSEWIGLDIGIDEIGIANTGNLTQVIFASGPINSLLVDNIYFYTQEGLIPDATLSDLKVNDRTVDGFRKTIREYNIELAFGTTVVPTVTATPSDANATYVVNDTEDLPGSTTVVVTAADGSTTSTYTLNFTVAGSNFADGLLTNGDFESGDDGSWTGDGKDIRAEGGNRFNFADVTSAGNPTDVSLIQALNLTGNSSYKLSFDASTSAQNGSRTLIAGVGLNQEPFTNSVQTITLSATEQRFELNLLGYDYQAVSRIFFDMGGDVGVVVIDNVSLSANNELVSNGDFENGGNSWYGNALDVRTEGGNSFSFANVATAGQSFDVNISQRNISVSAGARYLLSFKASTSPGNTRSILVGIGESATPFKTASQEINLTDTDQIFTVELEATDTDQGDFGGNDTRVLFDMGADVGVVVIDNVSLILLEN